MGRVMSREQNRLLKLPDLELRAWAFHHRRAAAREFDPDTRRVHLTLAAEFQCIADSARPDRTSTRDWRLGGGHAQPKGSAEVISIRTGRRDSARVHRHRVR